MGDIINAGADLLGFGPASKQADATENAANISAAASREATQLQKEMWQTQRSDQMPWLNAGTNALTQMQGYRAPSRFQFGANEFNANQDPGYAFRLKEGMKALEGSAAARGGLLSGNAMRAAVGYGQEMGSQEYQGAYNRALTGYNANRTAEDVGYNRLASLAGVGQNAMQQVGAAGQSYANQAGSNMMTNAANSGNAALQMGNVRASQYQNLGSAINTGYNMMGGGSSSYSNSAPLATMWANVSSDPLGTLISSQGW